MTPERARRLAERFIARMIELGLVREEERNLMPTSRRYYATAEFEDGLRCIDCNRLFVEGDEIRERPYAMSMYDGRPMVCVELICVSCEEGDACPPSL